LVAIHQQPPPGQQSVWRQISEGLQQAITLDHLQGRVNATMGVTASASVPLGGLLGGALGTFLGLRTTLVVAAMGEILSVVWLLSSPLRSLREQPEVAR
jgi:hypothetical protein